MIVLIIATSILLITISIIQYKSVAKEYNQRRVENIERYVKKHINYVLSNTTYPLTNENIKLIFKDKIHEVSDIQNAEIQIYSLEGKLLKSSKESFSVEPHSPTISKFILRLVRSSINKRYVDVKTIDGIKYRSSYSLIKNKKFKPIGILLLPNIPDDGYYEKELNNFLIHLAQVYTFMIIVAFAFAYFLSSFITKPINDFAKKLSETSLNQKSKIIPFSAKIKEINMLLIAYNRMIEELERNAIKLAQNERDLAWREMAKQVAHEIKNPLTPMRLTVQSFQRRFNPEDANIKQKLNDFSESLIQQIDTMSSVASAFSNFASMPAQQNEVLNVVEVVELTLDIFNEDYIVFESQEKEIISKMDRTQLIRVITNLVKNATQAIPSAQKNKWVLVTIKKIANEVIISIQDNGTGIEKHNFNNIFEPKFTTKNSGMGLGLGIIKNIIENYNGTITFETKFGSGTTFTVTLPITNT
ncbi:sensor histidine kinase [Flavobacterium laiguense]|uniref:histidine kinase n=1 Tax=Flavobacterium laiguense TaxID=2169409 RepID=A0A2U1K3E5_9FLAO|nr:HAMP domain-containing sensor histidine kinase [Flavobacterium laiguense]PWA11765.1 two-component sensor histidine kinase [Flavobacterium laiguense]